MHLAIISIFFLEDRNSTNCFAFDVSRWSCLILVLNLDYLRFSITRFTRYVFPWILCMNMAACKRVYNVNVCLELANRPEPPKTRSTHLSRKRQPAQPEPKIPLFLKCILEWFRLKWSKIYLKMKSNIQKSA